MVLWWSAGGPDCDKVGAIAAAYLNRAEAPDVSHHSHLIPTGHRLAKDVAASKERKFSRAICFQICGKVHGRCIYRAAT